MMILHFKPWIKKPGQEGFDVPAYKRRFNWLKEMAFAGRDIELMKRLWKIRDGEIDIEKGGC